MKVSILVNKETDDPLWPIWYSYYSKHVDHIEIIRLRENNPKHPPTAFAKEASAKQRELLKRYDVVLYADIDEFLIPDPSKYKDLTDYIDQNCDTLPRATGYQLVHNHATDAPIRLNFPLMKQRQFWSREAVYDKRLITNKPVSWSPGFHRLDGLASPAPDPELVLLHVLYCDAAIALQRLKVTYPQRTMINVLEKIESFELSVIPERFKIV